MKKKSFRFSDFDDSEVEVHGDIAPAYIGIRWNLNLMDNLFFLIRRRGRGKRGFRGNAKVNKIST